MGFLAEIIYKLIEILFVFVLLLLFVIIYLFFKAISHFIKRRCILNEICCKIMENKTLDCILLLENNLECINILNNYGYSPFLIACSFGNTQLVKYMLKRGANINQKSAQKESAFYLACFYYIRNPHIKNCSCIWELHYVGADINEPNAEGWAPIQMAAMFGHTSLVKWLLRKNAEYKLTPHPYDIAYSQGFQETATEIQKWILNNAKLAVKNVAENPNS